VNIYVDCRIEMLQIVRGLVERGLGFNVHVGTRAKQGCMYTIELTGTY